MLFRSITAWAGTQPRAVGHVRALSSPHLLHGEMQILHSPRLSPQLVFGCPRALKKPLFSPLPACLLWRCAASREFGSSPRHTGFVSPPLTHTGADLNHQGVTARIQKPRAGEHRVLFTCGGVWFFFLICHSNIQGTFVKPILSKLFTIASN